MYYVFILSEIIGRKIIRISGNSKFANHIIVICIAIDV